MVKNCYKLYKLRKIKLCQALLNNESSERNKQKFPTIKPTLQFIEYIIVNHRSVRKAYSKCIHTNVSFGIPSDVTQINWLAACNAAGHCERSAVHSSCR